MDAKWSHATDITNMGQLNFYFLQCIIILYVNPHNNMWCVNDKVRVTAVVVTFVKKPIYVIYLPPMAAQ